LCVYVWHICVTVCAMNECVQTATPIILRLDLPTPPMLCSAIETPCLPPLLRCIAYPQLAARKVATGDITPVEKPCVGAILMYSYVWFRRGHMTSLNVWHARKMSTPAACERITYVSIDRKIGNRRAMLHMEPPARASRSERH